MKSKISFFDRAIFRKNLTRFAPCWGIYTVFMLLILMPTTVQRDWLSRNLIDLITVMCSLTFAYALLCAQLLFGDLYNSRMCNALHALPLRRETWLGTNLISGLVFHLIPTGAMALASWLILNPFGGSGECMVAWLWFLAVNLQFLCFFGIAVVSAFCVGSRFSLAVAYGLFNFMVPILGWLIDTIYVDQIYGVIMETDPFLWFSPMPAMTGNPCLSAWVSSGDDRLVAESILLEFPQGKDRTLCITLGSGVIFYFIYALLGVALMALAFRLYRRRNLESAGDFVAIRGLGPVFLGMYTLAVAGCFSLIFDIGTGVGVLTGLTVGWFTGRMLLERTVRVFRKKSFAQWGILLVAFVLSLSLVSWDPLGIESWVPEVDDVASVTISNNYSGLYGAEVQLEDPVDIQKLTQLHQKRLDTYYARLRKEPATEDNDTVDFGTTIRYQLKNGQTRQRHYYLMLNEEDLAFIRGLYSRPASVFGHPEDVNVFLSENHYVTFANCYDGDEIAFTREEDLRSLYEALMADCKAGTMAQTWDFHRSLEPVYWLTIPEWGKVTLYEDCAHTLQWLLDQGVDVNWVLEQVGGQVTYSNPARE